MDHVLSLALIHDDFADVEYEEGHTRYVQEGGEVAEDLIRPVGCFYLLRRSNDQQTYRPVEGREQHQREQLFPEENTLGLEEYIESGVAFVVVKYLRLIADEVGKVHNEQTCQDARDQGHWEEEPFVPH